MIHSRSIRATLLVVAALFTIGACASTRTQKSVGENVDDAVIAARIKADLIGDPLTKAREIDVEVFKGRVQLNGFVAPTRYARRPSRSRAASMASPRSTTT